MNNNKILLTVQYYSMYPLHQQTEHNQNFASRSWIRIWNLPQDLGSKSGIYIRYFSSNRWMRTWDFRFDLHFFFFLHASCPFPFYAFCMHFNSYIFISQRFPFTSPSCCSDPSSSSSWLRLLDKEKRKEQCFANALSR